MLEPFNFYRILCWLFHTACNRCRTNSTCVMCRRFGVVFVCFCVQCALLDPLLDADYQFGTVLKSSFVCEVITFSQSKYSYVYFFLCVRPNVVRAASSSRNAFRYTFDRINSRRQYSVQIVCNVPIESKWEDLFVELSIVDRTDT